MAQDTPGRYEHCVGLAANAPSEALNFATDWLAETGAHAAQHCLALALFGLGQYDQAARTFTELAAAMTGPVGVRANLEMEAGEAWLLADAPDQARTSFARAEELDPDSARPVIGLARAEAAGGAFENAVALLTQILDRAPGRDDVLVFRATAYRHLDLIDLAHEDLDAALEINPNNGDAWVERGIIWLARDQHRRARKAFTAAILADRDSPAAELARAYLDTIDEVVP